MTVVEKSNYGSNIQLCVFFVKTNYRVSPDNAVHIGFPLLISDGGWQLKESCQVECFPHGQEGVHHIFLHHIGTQPCELSSVDWRVNALIVQLQITC
jgi:hypothetical protein